MLEPLLSLLEKKRIVLASASPRRKEILNMLGFHYDVVASSFEENLDKDAYSPAQYCIRTAEGKARDVARSFQEKKETVDLVIGADTVVVKGTKLYEKPRDSSDAERMLAELSGQGHIVQTGVALFYRCCQDDFKSLTFHETTEVFMAPMTQEIIKAYVRTGEPLDKAGAYAIQGKGGSIVEKIVGDFYNVMGFPLHRFCKELGDLYTKLGEVK